MAFGITSEIAICTSGAWPYVTTQRFNVLRKSNTTAISISASPAASSKVGKEGFRSRMLFAAAAAP